MQSSGAPGPRTPSPDLAVLRGGRRWRSACLPVRRFQQLARLRPRRAELLLTAEHRGTQQLLGSRLGRLEQRPRLCLCPLENGSGVTGGLLALLLSLLVRELKYLHHATADPFVARTLLLLHRDGSV